MKLGGDLVEEGSVSVGVRGIREGKDECDQRVLHT